MKHINTFSLVVAVSALWFGCKSNEPGKVPGAGTVGPTGKATAIPGTALADGGGPGSGSSANPSQPARVAATPLTEAQAWAQVKIDAASWPALDCTVADDATDLLRGLRYGFGDDGDMLLTRLIRPASLPSKGPSARFVAACAAASAGDHATAKSFIAQLSAPTCSKGALVLRNLDRQDCRFDTATLAVANTAVLPPMVAARLAAVKKLQSDDLKMVASALGATVQTSMECSVCDDSKPAVRKLSNKAAVARLGANDDHHLQFGYLIGCIANTCSYGGERLTHSSSNVHKVTFDKSNKIVAIEGVDG